jgi:hypothetical protein
MVGDDMFRMESYVDSSMTVTTGSGTWQEGVHGVPHEDAISMRTMALAVGLRPGTAGRPSNEWPVGTTAHFVLL